MKPVQIDILRWLVLTLMAGSIILTSKVHADDFDFDDKHLYTNCATMYLIVEELRKEPAIKTGLTESSIRNAAESRLRSARIFNSDYGDQYLYINVNLSSHSNAYSLRVELKRFLDTGFGFSGYIPVWKLGSVGTHGGDGQFVLGAISEFLDEFITKYLRMNEGECTS